MRFALKYLAVAVVIVFWVAYVYSNWQSFASLSWRLDPAYLLAGFVLYVGFFLGMAMGWVLTLRALGRRVDFVEGTRVWILSMPARYLPGRVWHIASRAYMGSEIGITTQELLVSSYLEHALAVVSGLLLFVLAVPALGADLVGANLLYLILIPVGIALSHPKVLALTLNRISLALKKRPVEINLRFSQVLLLFAWFGTTHILAGLSLFLVLSAVSPPPLDWLPSLLGVSAFAWVVGLLTLFSPGGIGVRETTVVMLASPFVAVPIISSAAFITRFVSALAEAFLVGAVVLLTRRQRRASDGLGVDTRS